MADEIPPELVAQVRAAIIDVSRKHCAVSRDPVSGALILAGLSDAETDELARLLVESELRLGADAERYHALLCKLLVAASDMTRRAGQA